MLAVLNQYINDRNSISINSINTIKNYIRTEYDTYTADFNELINDDQLEFDDEELLHEINIEQSRFDSITVLMKKAKLL